MYHTYITVANDILAAIGLFATYAYAARKLFPDDDEQTPPKSKRDDH
jgi:hypothetical protein